MWKCMSMIGALHLGASCARSGDAAAIAPSDARTVRLSILSLA
jgi:hypothetical protein